MSMTFTKLFSSITESTIWAESSEVRVVWITMLAMADGKGRVWASIPGLANRSRVSIEQCELALSKFMAPDKYSRTPDFDGRRIEPIDGGWRLLNHAKYRAIRDEEAIKESKRKYINTKRAIDRGVENVDQCRTQSNSVERCRGNAEADAEAEPEAKTHIKDSTHQGYKGGVGEVRDGACAPAIENGSGSIESDPKDAAAMSRRLGDKNGSERQKRLRAEVYHEHSRTVLYYLNEATGRHYREIPANLDPISARLNEAGVDLEGVKLMIDRQVKLWGGTEMQEYLKPTTLFRVSKFDGYYASRLVEISRPKTAFEKMCPPPLHDWSKEEGGEIDFASISQEVQ